MYPKRYRKPDTIILAAGAASRFGRDKILEPVNGLPMVIHSVMAALKVSERIIIVTSEKRAPLLHALSLPEKSEVIINQNPQDGMFSSIKCGVSKSNAPAVFIQPGDCPYVTSRSFLSLLTAFSGEYPAFAASFEGRKGHPVLLSAKMITMVLSSSKNQRLDFLLGTGPVCLVETGEPGVLKDVDRPGDIVLEVLCNNENTFNR
ncbi:MAG: NTP transferase domain-containing protein [Spirochaetia bacterium]